jgi:hypothetical protein
MREHYRFAFKNTPENESINAYPLTNWGAAEAILSWSDPGADKTLLGELRRYVGHAVAEANRKWKESPEFWDGVVEPDCLLMMALFKDEIAEKDIQMIAEGYRSAAERGASNKDITALREHIEFLIAMAEQFKKTDHRKSLLEILRQLP